MRFIGPIVAGVLVLTVGMGFMSASFPYTDTLGYMIGFGLATLGGLLAIGGTVRWVLHR